MEKNLEQQLSKLKITEMGYFPKVGPESSQNFQTLTREALLYKLL